MSEKPKVVINKKFEKEMNKPIKIRKGASKAEIERETNKVLRERLRRFK